MTQGIFKAIPQIMNDVEAVAKSSKNQQQGYQYRGIDQVYQALQLVLAKHQVFTVPEVLEEKSEERQSRNGGTLIYRILKIKYSFYHADGSNISAVVIGEGLDSGDKASNKAMSVGHKYALLQVFCIPTDEPKDPEVDSHELKSKAEMENLKKQNSSTEKNTDTSANTKKPMTNQELIKNTLQGFDKLGVSREKIETLLQCSIYSAGDEKIKMLREIGKNIRDKKVTVAQVFGASEADKLNALL